MIDPNKLFHLSPGQKRRKLALSFGALERDIAGIAEAGTEYHFSSMSRAEYENALCEILLKDPKLNPASAQKIRELLSQNPLDERRLCNVARNALLEILGTFPAEWDLVIAPHSVQIQSEERTCECAPSLVQKRAFFPGVCVYAEDIRSPFNLGSIFRTAEGMGAEKIFLSPLCAEATHPRAIRSAMGCIETLGYERVSLDELPADENVFVLETGGTPIERFEFPSHGICIIGSEELGASPEALKRATYGRVTIPMVGLKASLNVGVAFGILMQKWTEALRRNSC